MQESNPSESQALMVRAIFDIVYSPSLLCISIAMKYRYVVM